MALALTPFVFNIANGATDSAEVDLGADYLGYVGPLLIRGSQNKTFLLLGGLAPGATIVIEDAVTLAVPLYQVESANQSVVLPSNLSTNAPAYNIFRYYKVRLTVAAAGATTVTLYFLTP